MDEAPHYVLFEHAVGYTIFKVKEFEDIGQILPEVQAALCDLSRFHSIVQVHAFEPFKNAESALDNVNHVSEGLVHEDLLLFLEANLPKKKKKYLLGVTDSKLGGSIAEQFGARCTFTGVVPEIVRGIRTHFDQLVKDLQHHSAVKAQLALGHSYSRSKVKFDVHRVDNMIIQSIAILDQLDKDINLFGMRIKEWYAYHFPELSTLVPDQYNYVRCAALIKNRVTMDESTVEGLMGILDNEEKCVAIVEAARTSMGMEISDLDLMNIERFSVRVASLWEFRERLHNYLKDRMNSCAPSLCALIGEQVGARLISHSGSLTNLAKNPASTIQILGAEKALFRAFKTKTNTPKYGLIFHSSFIGRAAGKNKGRISRFVANKCSLASRIDCFSEVPVSTYGEFLRQQVEDRLKYFETGNPQKKNLVIMEEAKEEALIAQQKILKKKKKAAKKAKKELEYVVEKTDENGDVEMKEELAEA